MTNQQLTQLLTSANASQVEEAVSYFAQQNLISQDLLTECFVAWQLVADKKVNKKLTDLLKTYTPSSFQVFIKPKYLLAKQKETSKANKLLQEIENAQVGIDMKQLTLYLFPFFPAFLWVQMEKHCNGQEKDQLFGHSYIQSITQLNLSALKLKSLDERIGNFVNLTYLNLVGNSFKELPQSIVQLQKLEKLEIPELKKFPTALSHFPNLTNALAILLKLDELPQDAPQIIQNTNSKALLTLFEYDHINYLMKNNHLWEILMAAGVGNSILKIDLTFALKNLKNLEKIKDLPNLEILRIILKDLRKANFDVFVHLKKLRILDLSNCELDCLPDAFSTLENLEELKLSDSRGLTNAGFKPLAYLKKLKKLDITNCKLTEIPLEFKNLENLKNLILPYNDFSKANFSPFKNLKNLKKLDLNDCKLQEFPEAFSHLKNLEELYLNKSSISKADFSPFKNFKKLKTLDLANCDLNKLPQALEYLENLEELILGDYWDESNNFSNEDFTLLQQLKKLKKITLKACQLTKVPEILLKLESLQYLNIIYYNKAIKSTDPILLKLKDKGVRVV